jgi:murein peptide amidase A
LPRRDCPPAQQPCTGTHVALLCPKALGARPSRRPEGGAATKLNRIGACLCAITAGGFLPALSDAAGRAAPDVVGRRTVLLGRSTEGRPITAVELGDFDSPRKALVVGCIHGDECAGYAIATRLAHATPPGDADLWIVPEANPDGAAAGTRGNAHAVDLNRNFPWRWERLSGATDSGPRPLSERETRILYALLRRLRPAVSIWFHQPLDLVDDSSGSRRVERRFAAAAHMRLATLPREPGSAVTWETHCLPGGSAFVVELPAGRASRAAAQRLARAVLLTLASLPVARPTLATACVAPP